MLLVLMIMGRIMCRVIIHPEVDCWATDSGENPSSEASRSLVTWTPRYQHITLLYGLTLEESRPRMNQCYWERKCMAKDGGEWNDGKWSEKQWREVKMAEYQ